MSEQERDYVIGELEKASKLYEEYLKVSQIHTLPPTPPQESAYTEYRPAPLEFIVNR